MQFQGTFVWVFLTAYIIMERKPSGIPPLVGIPPSYRTPLDRNATLPPSCWASPLFSIWPVQPQLKIQLFSIIHMITRASYPFRHFAYSVPLPDNTWKKEECNRCFIYRLFRQRRIKKQKFLHPAEIPATGIKHVFCKIIFAFPTYCLSSMDFPQNLLPLRKSFFLPI